MFQQKMNYISFILESNYRTREEGPCHLAYTFSPTAAFHFTKPNCRRFSVNWCKEEKLFVIQIDGRWIKSTVKLFVKESRSSNKWD